jgi:hypothetical protein
MIFGCPLNLFGCPKMLVARVKTYRGRQFLPSGIGKWLVQGRFYPYGERFLVGMVAAKHLLSGRVLYSEEVSPSFVAARIDF